MNVARIVTIAFLCLTAASGQSNAGDFHYECKVVSAVRVTEEGTLSPDWATKLWMGVKFTVDRVTGRMIGGPLDNPNITTEVIDRGSREMSFQSFSRSTQMSHTTHIQIQEYISGADKPFVGTTTLYFPGVYSGICK